MLCDNHRHPKPGELMTDVAGAGRRSPEEDRTFHIPAPDLTSLWKVEPQWGQQLATYGMIHDGLRVPLAHRLRLKNRQGGPGRGTRKALSKPNGTAHPPGDRLPGAATPSLWTPSGAHGAGPVEGRGAAR